MSDSTRTDVNYLSYTGDGSWMRDAGSGHDFPVHGIPEDGVIAPPNPEAYASSLKLADGAVIELNGLDVAQSKECTIDINNHCNVEISGKFGTEGSPIGDQIFSIKGGSSAGIAGELRGRGHRLGADLIVDNWSDQSYSGSTVDVTELKHSSGRLPKVVKRYGASTIKGNHEVLVWPSVKLTAYWWVKWTVRKILRIPVGKKGPSWI